MQPAQPTGGEVAFAAAHRLFRQGQEDAPRSVPGRSETPPAAFAATRADRAALPADQGGRGRAQPLKPMLRVYRLQQGSAFMIQRRKRRSTIRSRCASPRAFGPAAMRSRTSARCCTVLASRVGNSLNKSAENRCPTFSKILARCPTSLRCPSRPTPISTLLPLRHPRHRSAIRQRISDPGHELAGAPGLDPGTVRRDQRVLRRAWQRAQSAGRRARDYP
jgi:hypothetical protein